MDHNRELTISFQDNESVLVVHLNGVVCSEQVCKFESIVQKISELSRIKYVIFEMSRILEVDSRTIFSFAKIQKRIRDQRILLRVCGVNSSLRKRLFNRGVLREDEAFDNVPLALKSLVRTDNRMAA